MNLQVPTPSENHRYTEKPQATDEDYTIQPFVAPKVGPHPGSTFYVGDLKSLSPLDRRLELSRLDLPARARYSCLDPGIQCNIPCHYILFRQCRDGDAHDSKEYKSACSEDKYRCTLGKGVQIWIIRVDPTKLSGG